MATSPWIAGGKQTFPVTQSYGATDYALEPPGHGYPHWHAGEDLGVGSGTRVTAGQAGSIDYAGWLGGYGYAVEERLANGLQVLLGHLSRPEVQTGQKVSAGAELGLSGSTGNSSGPHVHAEVRRAGSDVNPDAVIFGVGGSTPGGDLPGVQGIVGVVTGQTPISLPDPGGIGQGLSNLANALDPTRVGHALADTLTIEQHNLGVWLKRQSIALFVAAVVLLVLFA